MRGAKGEKIKNNEELQQIRGRRDVYIYNHLTVREGRKREEVVKKGKELRGKGGKWKMGYSRVIEEYKCNMGREKKDGLVQKNKEKIKNNVCFWNLSGMKKRKSGVRKVKKEYYRPSGGMGRKRRWGNF